MVLFAAKSPTFAGGPLSADFHWKSPAGSMLAIARRPKGLDSARGTQPQLLAISE